MAIKIRDRRNAGWFWVGNEVVEQLLQRGTCYTLALYTYLARHSRNDTQYLHRTVPQIAKESRMGATTIRQELKRLAEWGLIETEEVLHPNGACAGQRITLLDVAEATWGEGEAGANTPGRAGTNRSPADNHPSPDGGSPFARRRGTLRQTEGLL